jgi:murein DD-endopeptidase MepM/ murein hydrolase activator NlpD
MKRSYPSVSLRILVIACALSAGLALIGGPGGLSTLSAQELETQNRTEQDSAASSAQELGVRELHVPETVSTGRALTVFVSGVARTETATVALHTPAGAEYQSVRAFRMPHRAGKDGPGEGAVAALFGIGVNTEPGTYTVKAELTEASGSGGENKAVLTLVDTVRVEEGSFRSERISLNKSMTELRSGEDPRKAREARELLALLSRYRAGAVYEPGRFELPVKEFRISSYFGDRRTFVYVNGGTSGAIHTGLDLAAPTGTPTVAAGGGLVVFADERMLTGETVVIEQLPGVYGLYYHLDEIDVEAGQRVAKGERIGTVGATGLVTGPHLHWELRVNGVSVAPRQFTEAGLLDKAREMGIMANTTQRRG